MVNLKKYVYFFSFLLLLLAHTTFAATTVGEYSKNPLPQVFCESHYHGGLEEFMLDNGIFHAKTKKDISYSYNYVDLNNDGTDEIIALVFGNKMKGSGYGATLMIYNASSTGLNLINIYYNVMQPVIITDAITNNYKDIVVSTQSSLNDYSYCLLQYKNGSYSLALKNCKKLDSSYALTGKEILTDASGTYGTKQPLQIFTI